MSKCEVCGKEGFHKLSCTNNTARVAVPMTMHSAYIPTLEGDEAEEFIRKADEALKAEKTDWTLQAKRAERIIEKSRIISMKQIKNGNVNIKCERCGGCGYHKMSCSLNKVTFLNLDSRIAKRILHYAKSATQKVKRNKDVEP